MMYPFIVDKISIVVLQQLNKVFKNKRNNVQQKLKAGKMLYR